jgi:hypothetical protein
LLNIFPSFLPIPKQENQIKLNCLRYIHPISHHLFIVKQSLLAKNSKQEVLATTTRMKDIIRQCPKKRLDRIEKKAAKHDLSNNSEDPPFYKYDDEGRLISIHFGAEK